MLPFLNHFSLFCHSRSSLLLSLPNLRPIFLQSPLLPKSGRITGRPVDDTGGEATTRKAPTPKAFDALPLPLYLTNVVFFTLFFSIAYYLLHRWRDKIRNSTPLHIVTLSEIAAIVSLITSFIYLLKYFSIDFIQSFIVSSLSSEEDQKIVQSMVDGMIPSYSLESKLRDCKRPEAIRREALQRMYGRSLQGLLLDGFNYDSILG